MPLAWAATVTCNCSWLSTYQVAVEVDGYTHFYAFSQRMTVRFVRQLMRPFRAYWHARCSSEEQPGEVEDEAACAGSVGLGPLAFKKLEMQAAL